MDTGRNILSPSILSADFCKLGEQIKEVEQAGAEYLHIDVMDGLFVPSISYGMPVIASIRKCSNIFFDVHLMIVEPQKFIKEVKDLGATYMNVHLEACTHLSRVVQQIKEAGMKAGVTINPATPVSMLADIIDDIDLALIMSVNPGFGGQKFIQNSVKKVHELRDLISLRGSKALIEVDAGVNEETGRLLKDAGADILVAGNYVFGAENPLERISTLKNL